MARMHLFFPVSSVAVPVETCLMEAKKYEHSSAYQRCRKSFTTFPTMRMEPTGGSHPARSKDFFPAATTSKLSEVIDYFPAMTGLQVRSPSLWPSSRGGTKSATVAELFRWSRT